MAAEVSAGVFLCHLCHLGNNVIPFSKFFVGDVDSGEVFRLFVCFLYFCFCCCFGVFMGRKDN